MRSGLLVLVSASLIAGCATSFEPTKIQRIRFEPARQAEQRGDYATALNIYEDAAEDGTVYAQYRVARMYENGEGTEQDYAQAARWYAAASAAGHPQAHRALARLYEQGQGLEQDDTEALALYRKAAEAGDPLANFKVGQFLERGRGTEPDPTAAAGFYRAAAEAAVSTRNSRLRTCTGTARESPRTMPKPSGGTLLRRGP